MNQPLSERLVVPFEALRMTDVESVGGKNASLGEMISQLAHAGVRVPGGFATTAQAFRSFLQFNRLTDRIAARLEGLNIEDVKALAQCGEDIRGWMASAPLQPDLEVAIREAYQSLQADSKAEISVAVRSSATA
ncbi:MAG: phosphoenolpyruvate synthase, partial [Betaproteobacteria bacterium]|nr:phosphoenolpyruvate synthase [Betaproteobacteria bacterium]